MLTLPEFERLLHQRLDAFPPAARAELLHVLMLSDFDRAARIGEFHSNPRTRTFAELLIDLEEERAAQGMVVGMLRQRTHYGQWGEGPFGRPCYSRVFSDKTSAQHMVLVFSLLRGVEDAKRRLLAVPEEDRTQSQADQIDFFRKRGSLFVLVAAIAASVETYLNRAVPDAFALRFRDNPSPQRAMGFWRPIVDSVLPFANMLEPGLDQGLRNRERVAEVQKTFGSLVEATKSANSAVFDAFAEHLES